MTALWIDKYRPKSLAELSFHPETTNLLKQMASSGDIPHLLFTGPSGGGKKTRVSALLRELYGRGCGSVRAEKRTVGAAEGSGAKGVEVTLVTSNYHIEVSPADVGVRDRVVVQELVKEIAQSRPVDQSVPYKVVVIHDADCLSRGAQDALRRTMEKYMRACRIVLVATAACRVAPAIRSRCAHVRVPLPEPAELAAALQAVCREAKAGALPDELARRIAALSEGNARKAVLMLEAAHVANPGGLSPDTPLARADWEEYVAGIVMDVVKEQTPHKLAEIRMKIYELLTHCIPPEMVLKEHRIHMGTKPVYHIEAFIARFMSLYSKYMSEAMKF